MRALQRYLDRAGYETDVDGQFGRGTRTSVMSFEAGRDPPGRTAAPPGPSSASCASAPAATTPASATRRFRARAAPATRRAPPVTEAPGEEAYIGDDGLAVAPASAPQEVKDIIAAGNKIARKPYKYGGGHGRWRDSGYDCSGSVSYVLHAAGLLDSPLASGGFMGWGERGRGEWVTVRANAGHAYMIVAGLRFDTSARKVTGNRWSEEMRSARGFAGRHPEGL